MTPREDAEWYERNNRIGAAAKIYLDLGDKAALERCIRRLTKDDPTVTHFLTECNLRKLKDLGLLEITLEQMVNHDLCPSKWQFAPMLAAIGEFRLAAELLEPVASDYIDTTSQVASWWSRAGEKVRAVNCFLKLFSSHPSFLWGSLNALAEMGFLEQFAAGACQDPKLQTNLFRAVSNQCSLGKLSEAVLQSIREGGLKDLIGRVLKEEPLEVADWDLHAKVMLMAFKPVELLPNLIVAAERLEAQDKARNPLLRVLLWARIGEMSPIDWDKAYAFWRASECCLKIGDPCVTEMRERGVAASGDAFWELSAALLLKATRAKEGEEAYRKAGRKVRAARVNGKRTYSIEEAQQKLLPLWDKTPTSVAEAAGGPKISTQVLVDQGCWLWAAKLCFAAKKFEEFKRICLDHDELELAALCLEKAACHDEAARIYDEIALLTEPKETRRKSKGSANQGEQSKTSAATETESLICSQCGAELKPHWTICPKCDADLQQRNCKNCGEPLEPEWKRCPVCRSVVTSSE